MANFVFEKYNSMPEQVEENKENIKKLCGYIKDAYHTNNGITLNDSDVSVAISDTNADATTEDGWLLDDSGKFFKITSGDGVNLLIEYYTNFVGPEGPEGPAGQDGADGQNGNDGYSIRYYDGIFINTSYNYLKSKLSSNTNVIVGDIVLFKDGTIAQISTISGSNFNVTSNIDLLIASSSCGFYYTNTQPTISGDNLVLDNSSIINTTGTTIFKIGDMIAYKDANDKFSEFYEVMGFVGTTQLIVVKVADVGGKKLYQHNISYSRSAGSIYLRYDIVEITDDATEITTRAAFKQWLIDRGYTHLHPRKTNGGFYYSGSDWYAPVNIYINASSQIEYYYFNGSTNSYGTDVSETGTLTDQVIPL